MCGIVDIKLLLIRPGITHQAIMASVICVCVYSMYSIVTYNYILVSNRQEGAISRGVSVTELTRESMMKSEVNNSERRMACPAEYMVKLNHHRYIQDGQEPSKNNRTDYNILFLTPFSDTVARLTKYFQLMCSLSYPHERISIAFGQDSGFETTAEAANLSRMFGQSFRDVTFHSLVLDANQVNHKTRHKAAMQQKRRSHMALSRNELLFRAMKADHDWVIWLDVDLEYIPPNLVQLLLSANQPIVSPACVHTEPFRTYDRNIWRETAKGKKFIRQQLLKKHFNGDFLMMELSKRTMRRRITDIRNEGAVVPIDGVGCCVLLVNASCHRHGLIFPSFVFDSHIESEGLGKMAVKMGYPLYGMPFVQVFHDMKQLYINI